MAALASVKWTKTLIVSSALYCVVVFLILGNDNNVIIFLSDKLYNSSFVLILLNNVTIGYQISVTEQL